ncbi:MAG: urate hydroxylase PuuD [Alphaproteobacteria bacterium]|nr:urate hydroxylase PuuD [Alphaproteobacteria bacterium]
MAVILTNLYRTVTAGVVLALVLLAAVVVLGEVDIGSAFGGRYAWAYLFVWIHVLAGIMWIGHLYYFNFVQMIQMPKIPAEQKPAVSKFIAPEALWWFRWAAMLTIITGLVVAWLRGYLHDAYALGFAGPEGFDLPSFFIGTGMWLATIMWFNVWFVIWPNQKKALNIANAYPDLPQADKDKAARMAMLFSRTNVMLSIPMLLAMTGGGMNYGNSGL